MISWSSLRNLLDDLIGWRITTVRNGFSDSHETIDIESFCQRVYDYCQTQEELDKWWNYSDEVLAQFFKRDNSTDNSSPDDNNPEIPTSKEYEKLGFPTIAFASIPDEKKSSIVDELYYQLSSYVTCSTEEFRYLVLPTYPKEFSYQPRIKWHTGSQQLMRAVFTHLFPAAVINSPNKSCCYCYIEEKGKKTKNFQLNKNIHVISAEDNLEAERIISNCYKAVGLQRPITKLSTDK